MPKSKETADPGERQRPIGVAPVLLAALAGVLDKNPGTGLLGALCDDIPRAFARGQADDWKRAGHAIIDLIASTIESRAA